MCIYCELLLLHLLNSFKESFRARNEFKRKVLTKQWVAAILAVAFVHESLSEIREDPFSSMGRNEERGGVKIHTCVSRKMYNWFLMVTEVKRSCFVLPASSALGVHIVSTRCCHLDFMEGLPLL